jgi:hypothetical protein
MHYNCISVYSSFVSLVVLFEHIKSAKYKDILHDVLYGFILYSLRVQIVKTRMTHKDEYN